MYFPHRSILKACSGDLDDPEHFRRSYDLLVGDATVVPDFPDLLHNFLRSLPPAKSMRKIVIRLRAIAKTHGATFEDPRWWDIMKNLRALVVTVERDGHRFRIALYWRKTVKGERFYGSGNAHTFLPIRDPSHPSDWWMDIEASTYQEVKARFETWLSTPLRLPA